jgi:hypothetical protein
VAVTPTFGWPTPDDTDFVRDGAAAIRALGDAADASLDTVEQNSKDASNLDTGTLGSARLPAGTLLQVVRGTDVTDRSRTATSFGSATISVTITPLRDDSLLVYTWTFRSNVALISGSADNRFFVGRLFDVTNSVAIPGADSVTSGRSLVATSAASANSVSAMIIRGSAISGSTTARTVRGELRSFSSNIQVEINNSAAQGTLIVEEYAQ